MTLEKISPLTVKTGSGGLKIKDLRKSYKSKPVLRDINLTIPVNSTIGLVGTTGDTIAVKDAAASAAGTISTTVVSTPTVAVAGGTIAPTSAKKGVVEAKTLAGAETLKVYVRNAAGNAAGSALSSSEAGGTPIIVEVAYFVEDDVAGLDSTFIPYITET